MASAVVRAVAAATVAVLVAGCTMTSPAQTTPISPDPSRTVSAPSHDDAVAQRGSWVDFMVDNPRSHVGASTAIMVDDAIDALDPAPVPDLPVTVTSRERAGDREVEVTDVSRIVAMDLSGSITAAVWALGLGDNLVGRDIAADFPGVEDLPVVTGSAHTVVPEAVLAQRPTVVITDGSIGPSAAVTQLRDAGVPVVYVANEPTFAGAGELITEVAAALGVDQAGEELSRQLQEEIDAERDLIASVAPQGDDRLRMMFLYLRGSAGVYYIFGGESGADEMIDALGGIDVAEEVGLDGMKPMTDEAMLAADPDVILVMTHGLESVGGVEGLVADRPAIGLTTAGRNQRIVDMADSQILAFGPRSADILDALARALYAPEM